MVNSQPRKEPSFDRNRAGRSRRNRPQSALGRRRVGVLQALVLQRSDRPGRLDYDPKLGSFRGWLVTIVRNRLRDLLEKRGRQEQGAGDTAMLDWLQQQPDRLDGLADQVGSRIRAATCYDRRQRIRKPIRRKNLASVLADDVDGQSGKEVAHTLDMTVAAVYLAKSRVMARLKLAIRKLQAEFWETAYDIHLSGFAVVAEPLARFAFRSAARRTERTFGILYDLSTNLSLAPARNRGAGLPKSCIKRRSTRPQAGQVMARLKARTTQSETQADSAGGMISISTSCALAMPGHLAG